MCQTESVWGRIYLVLFFFSFPFKLYIFPLLLPGLLRLIVIIAGVKVSRATGWMTYMWCCALARTSCCPGPFPWMAALLLHKCGSLNCGFTCKFILLLVSTAQELAFQANTHHMYRIRPTDFKLATKKSSPASASTFFSLSITSKL